MAKEGPKQTVFFCDGHNGDPADGFGRSTANPVLCSSVVGGYFYLDRLESLDGATLLFARIRTQRLDNGHTLDCYRITKEGSPLILALTCTLMDMLEEIPSRLLPGVA